MRLTILLCMILMSVGVAHADPPGKAVTQAEYFWDTDPGAGSGTAMLALDDNLDEVIEELFKDGIATPAALGPHTFNVRVKDVDGVWSTPFATVVTTTAPPVVTVARDVKVVQAEYFWDTDPGAGSGTAMLALDGNLDEVIEELFKDGIATPAALGPHTFNVRVKDVDGVWSTPFATVVTTTAPPVVTVARDVKVVQAEYFWDTDPGAGSGTAMLALDGNLDEVIEELFKDGIATPAALGPHTFNVRVKDVDGVWSTPFATVVTTTAPPVVTVARDVKVVQAEYFWDTDPGAGSGTAMLALDGNLDEVIEELFKDGIATPAALGPHTFNVRVKDVDGVWSAPFATVVTTTAPPVATVARDVKVVQAEYFWDTDPGAGSGTAMLALDGNLDEVIEELFKDGIATPAALGPHTFNVRVKDVDGVWSAPFATVVTTTAPPVATVARDVKVVQAEYFWDTDPGAGSGTAMLALDGNLDEVIEELFKDGIATPAALGPHTFNVRVKDVDGVWSTPFRTVISVEVLNFAPTALALAPSAVNENLPAGTVVGQLSAADPDAGDTFTFTLVSGTGSTDNALFTIVGNELRLGSTLDAEAAAQRSVRVRVTDSGGFFHESTFIIAVNDIRTEDADSDGLTEAQEEDIYGTSDVLADTDSDGVNDGVEVAFGTSPTQNTATPTITLAPASVVSGVTTGIAVGALSLSPSLSGVSYSLAGGTGDTDNAQFAITGAELQTAATILIAQGATRSVRVRALKSGSILEQVLTVTVNSAPILPPVPFSEFIDPHPIAGNQFGHSVVALSTGNVVITSPFDDAGGSDAGAVYLFNGASGALISTLTGSHANDNIGKDGVVALGNGNFVVISTLWDNGTAADVGAVTFGNGSTGVSGTVSAANSLVGSTANDQVGFIDGVYGSVIPLGNGNYVVRNSLWDNGAATDAGAVTFGNGSSGVTGVVSAANSLVGSSADDKIGTELGDDTVFDGYPTLVVLNNHNYVVLSSEWNNGGVVDAGAVTWASGTTGVTGAVSSANSLVGTQTSDQVGVSGVLEVGTGNFVIVSEIWKNGAVNAAGAVTWANGTTGITGTINASNSLIGSASLDLVGSGGITVLTNGNYVVSSPLCKNGVLSSAGAATWAAGNVGVVGAVSTTNSFMGTAGKKVSSGGVKALTNGHYVVVSPTGTGSATWGNGTTGITGTVSSSNSLVGGGSNNRVGFPGVVSLSNGNYVVCSSFWDNGAVADVGAVTWGNGTSGTVGTVSSSNSLVGSRTLDYLGSDGNDGAGDDRAGLPLVTALTNGNYVVCSPYWDASASITDAGAATWCDGTTGLTGALSSANSLVGDANSDLVGLEGSTALSNGHYTVGSSFWSNGANTSAGAVTWGNGTTGRVGAVSSSNSLVGGTANNRVGSGRVTVLSTGNYVVVSPLWDNGATSNVGAVTRCSGTTGQTGVVGTGNSTVGSLASDQVGSGRVTALPSGHFVINSPNWNGLRGAITWRSGSGTVGLTVGSTNSRVGSTALDQVVVSSSDITIFSTGHFAARARLWDNGAFDSAGAVTFGSGTGGLTSGAFTASNSFIGGTASANLQTVVADDVNGTFMARFIGEGGGRVRIASQSVGFTQPEIAVQQPGGVNLVDGAAAPIGFGTVALGGHSDLVFTVANSGAASLTGLVMTVDGPAQAMFSIIAAPVVPVASAGSTTFTVRFAPFSLGVKTATLHIYSNDTNETPFDINLTGTGNTLPVFAGMSVNTVQGKVTSIAEAKILQRASDADGQALSITGFSATSTGGGTITRSGGSMTYTPLVTFSGADTFTVTISDGLSPVVGTITVNVAADPGLNPSNPPQITPLTGGAIRLGFFGIPGRTYGIQRSTNLTTWTQIAAPTANAQGVITVDDSTPPQPSAFYRIVYPAQ